MDYQLLIILVLFVAVLGFVYLTLTDKKAENKKKEQKENPNLQIRKKEKKVELVNLNKFIEFDKVIDDMIVENGETKYTMAIQCKGINFDIMSDLEQIKVEKAFIDFISRINYPIQIFVESRTIDLKENIENYKQKVVEYDLKCQDAELEYQKLMQSMDIDSNKIRNAQLKMQRANNLYQYVADITNYIEKISYNKQMLQRKFYILFSIEKKEMENVKPKNVQTEAYNLLFKRACGIIEDLSKCQVVASVLSSKHLVELLYNNLSFDDEKLLPLMQAVESGFYNIYSSTRQKLMERNQVLYQEYLQEREQEEQRKRTFERENGITRKNVDEKYDREEKIDKMAVKIIANADIDLETKDALTKLIVKKHIDTLKSQGYEIDTSIEMQRENKVVKNIIEATDNTAALQ